MPNLSGLLDLGWQPAFAEQLSHAERQRLVPARVFAASRTGITALGEANEYQLPLSGRWYQQPVQERPTVGDWVLVDDQAADPRVVRLLKRTSLLCRVNPGRVHEPQPIAANVNTLFIVSSCNAEFNVRRLERYVALAYQAEVAPVLVLTKTDLTHDVERFLAQAAELSVPLLPVNATDAGELQTLKPWCTTGQTVALVGSSGVGKSTLVNSLLGVAVQATGGIREEDGKGRHTTTHRSLHQIPDGGLLLDSPGIRELQISDAQAGIRAAFADVEDLAAQCRFNDCRHLSEPSCAVTAAIAAGTLSQLRLDSYRKLLDEQG